MQDLKTVTYSELPDEVSEVTFPHKRVRVRPRTAVVKQFDQKSNVSRLTQSNLAKFNSTSQRDELSEALPYSQSGKQTIEVKNDRSIASLEDEVGS